MSSKNFKGWTSEAVAEREQRQLSKRLDAVTTGQSYAAKVRANSPKAKRLVEAVVDMFSGSPSANIKPRKVTKEQPEYKIQAAYVRTMNTRHPEILVFSDCAAHIKKTKFQQMRANALSSPSEKWPDVFVAQPSGDYAGLYLEFKAETPYKVDGVTLKKNEHNEAQAATMARLTSKGYLCYFVWTVEQAIEITEKYLNL